MFNKNLIQLRKQNNLTQVQVAKVLGVSPKTYGHWERGYSEPDYEMLKKLAKIFDCSYEELLD